VTAGGLLAKTTPGLARFSGSAWTTYMYNYTSGPGITDEYVTWPGTLASDKPLVGNWIRRTAHSLAACWSSVRGGGSEQPADDGWSYSRPR
jgi:hypothetical protein